MKKSIKDIDLAGKRVFLRADFNVPIINNQIADDYRVKMTLPTIEYLLDHNIASLVIGSHLGRPNGKYDFQYSLEPVFLFLKVWFQKRNLELKFSAIYEKNYSPYVLLDNLRFVEEEEHAINETKLKFYFESIADFVVMDAFGVCHRETGSINRTGLEVYAGLLVLQELEMFYDLVSNKKDIDLIILGGKKVKDKLRLIKGFINKAHKIFIGGGLSNTFLVTQGKNIGASFYEADLEKDVCEIMELAKQNNTEIILPVDFVGHCENKYIQCNELDGAYVGVDIGKKTTYMLNKLVMESKKIFWNGPPGLFEIKESLDGTRALVESLSLATKNGALTIVGGGDTASAVNRFGDRSSFTHVSTGGGALLELLQGKPLPGIEVIKNKD
ncbi:hypothetical protein COBT_000191 [Conglomerata obtusa]